MLKKEMQMYLDTFKEFEIEEKEALEKISIAAQSLTDEEISKELIATFRDVVIVRNKFSYMKFVLCIQGIDVVEKMSNIEALADDIITSMRNQIIGLFYRQNKSETTGANVVKFEKYAALAGDENIENFITTMLPRKPANKIDKRK